MCRRRSSTQLLAVGIRSGRENLRWYLQCTTFLRKICLHIFRQAFAGNVHRFIQKTAVRSIQASMYIPNCYWLSENGPGSTMVLRNKTEMREGLVSDTPMLREIADPLIVSSPPRTMLMLHPKVDDITTGCIRERTHSLICARDIIRAATKSERYSESDKSLHKDKTEKKGTHGTCVLVQQHYESFISGGTLAVQPGTAVRGSH